ncbi:hypothetical protein M408DRAFT_330894 [Serendipita vermifera MAFF 305830]|uniref:Uncharacterized protein n=1 Tax=Serendipita vermifera MAFF 305830 TaxID=933852 RepID=A0A0C2WHM9_SERVB|nr:hypothetical protein M408DRAFT_330894 [Serendipita vermifera MAFF 305830]
MFATKVTSLVATLLLVVNSVSATPVDLVERAACNKVDYGPFRLYAAPANDPTAEPLLLKLIDLYTPRPTNDTIQALSICPADDCGHTPSYWELKDKVLYAVYAGGQEGYSTVNKPVVADAEVRFVNSDDASIAGQLAPEWCAVRQPGTTNGLPGYLSVLGSAEEFSYCTNIPWVGTPERADIQYKADTTNEEVEQYCTKVHLVIQSIGIIAEPIPDTEV